MPAFACGAAAAGVPGVDAVAVAGEHGQLQLQPALQQVLASQTEQIKPQQLKTEAAMKFNMTKLQMLAANTCGP